MPEPSLEPSARVKKPIRKSYLRIKRIQNKPREAQDVIIQLKEERRRFEEEMLGKIGIYDNFLKHAKKTIIWPNPFTCSVTIYTCRKELNLHNSGH